MRLQTNGWTPQLVPRPDFDSPFRSEYVSGRVRAPSGTSGLDYSLKFERGPSSTSNQTHKVINTIQHQLIPRSTPTASIARGRAGRVPAFQHPALWQIGTKFEHVANPPGGQKTPRRTKLVPRPGRWHFGFPWNSNHAFVPRPSNKSLHHYYLWWNHFVPLLDTNLGREKTWFVQSLRCSGGPFDSHAHYVGPLQTAKNPLFLVPWWTGSKHHGTDKSKLIPTVTPSPWDLFWLVVGRLESSRAGRP